MWPSSGRRNLLFTLCVLVVVVASGADHCNVNGSRIATFKPRTIYLNRFEPQKFVKLTCSQPIKKTYKPEGIVIKRSKLTEVQDPKVLAKGSDTLPLSSLRTLRKNVSGNYRTAVSIVLSGKCSTADYLYVCNVDFYDKTSKKPVYCVDSVQIKVLSRPEDVIMTKEPDYNSFPQGSLLILTCSATVGVLGEYTNVTFEWETRFAGLSWTLAEGHRSMGELKLEHGCLWVRTAQYRVVLTSERDGQEVRCYTIKDGVSFSNVSKFFLLNVYWPYTTAVAVSTILMVGSLAATGGFIAYYYTEYKKEEEAQKAQIASERLTKVEDQDPKEDETQIDKTDDDMEVDDKEDNEDTEDKDNPVADESNLESESEKEKSEDDEKSAKDDDKTGKDDDKTGKDDDKTGKDDDKTAKNEKKDDKGKAGFKDDPSERKEDDKDKKKREGKDKKKKDEEDKKKKDEEDKKKKEEEDKKKKDEEDKKNADEKSKKKSLTRGAVGADHDDETRTFI